jgi:hypothetical protein
MRLRNQLLVLAIVVVAFGGTMAYLTTRPPAKQEAREPGCSPELKQFLESYFSTWSAGDMAGYQDHFHPQARIAYVEKEKVYAFERDPFVRMNDEARRRTNPPPTEVMTGVSAIEDPFGASAVAHWTLREGNTTTRGIDRFILIRDENRHWRIVSLVYYATDSAGT